MIDITQQTAKVLHILVKDSNNLTLTVALKTV